MLGGRDGCQAQETPTLTLSRILIDLGYPLPDHLRGWPPLWNVTLRGSGSRREPVSRARPARDGRQRWGLRGSHVRLFLKLAVPMSDRRLTERCGA